MAGTFDPWWEFHECLFCKQPSLQKLFATIISMHGLQHCCQCGVSCAKTQYGISSLAVTNVLKDNIEIDLTDSILPLF